MKVQTRLREFRKCRGLYTLLTRGATKITDNYWITEKNYWKKKNYWFLKFHLESHLGHTHEIPFNPQYILFCILMGVQEPLIKFATEHFFVKSLKVQTRLREFLKSIPFIPVLPNEAPTVGPKGGSGGHTGMNFLTMSACRPTVAPECKN